MTVDMGQASGLEVTVDGGRIRGGLDTDVVTWHAIPYAAPPVGELRLRAPQPVRSWSQVRDATRFRDAAMSHPLSSPLGVVRRQRQSEDCLTLNVCAPARRGGDPLPVMVFIHGGGFFEGSSGWPLYDPKPLVRRGDVVLVTINYRLNALGWVDFSPYSTPERWFDSNIGLRDQIAALGWVQRNIAEFGGDPGNVTLFGESAGAVSVTTLFAVPSARGLFHRGIAQSGPADAVNTPERASEVAARVLAGIGASETDAAAALSTVDAPKLVRAALRALPEALSRVPGRMPYAPFVDGELIPENPLAAFAAGRAHRLPLITGTNRHELNLHGTISNLLPSRPRTIDRMLAAGDSTVRDEVFATYSGVKGGPGPLRFATDSFFVRPTLEVCDGHQGFAPTWLYRFDYAPKPLRWSGIGAFHGLELFSVFGAHGRGLGRALSAAGDAATFGRVSHEIQDHWLHFAKTGVPQDDWTPYTLESRSAMVFDTRSRMVDDPHARVRDVLRRYRGPYRSHAPSAVAEQAGSRPDRFGFSSDHIRTIL